MSISNEEYNKILERLAFSFELTGKDEFKVTFRANYVEPIAEVTYIRSLDVGELPEKDDMFKTLVMQSYIYYLYNSRSKYIKSIMGNVDPDEDTKSYLSGVWNESKKAYMFLNNAQIFINKEGAGELYDYIQWH